MRDMFGEGEREMPRPRRPANEKLQFRVRHAPILKRRRKAQLSRASHSSPSPFESQPYSSASPFVRPILFIPPATDYFVLLRILCFIRKSFVSHSTPSPPKIHRFKRRLSFVEKTCWRISVETDYQFYHRHSHLYSR
jgi:hypothetical protein